jgi:hypothetical protein
MPTVFRVAGFRVYFYSHELGEPPHVHVDRAGSSAKVWLDSVTLASNAGFSSRELGEVLRLVRDHQRILLEAWHDFFGRRGDG